MTTLVSLAHVGSVVFPQDSLGKAKPRKRREGHPLGTLASLGPTHTRQGGVRHGTGAGSLSTVLFWGWPGGYTRLEKERETSENTAGQETFELLSGEEARRASAMT